MRTNIKDLDAVDARAILKHVFPNAVALKFNCFEFAESEVIEDDLYQFPKNQKISGIRYDFGHSENLLLPFNDTRVVMWLYDEGYEISNLLALNQNYTQLISEGSSFIKEVGEAIHNFNWRKRLDDVGRFIARIEELYNMQTLQPCETDCSIDKKEFNLVEVDDAIGLTK